MFRTSAQALRIAVHIRSKGYSAARLDGAPANATRVLSRIYRLGEKS